MICHMMFLSIGTPKIVNFLFVANGESVILRCPNIKEHCSTQECAGPRSAVGRAPDS